MHPPRHLTVNRLVAAVVATAVVAAVCDVALSHGYSLVGSDVGAFVVLAACCGVSELRPLRWLRSTDERTLVTGSWTFMMAMLMLAQPIVAVSVAAGLLLLSDLWARIEAIKVVFNVAQMVVALSISASILHLFGQGAVLHHHMPPDLVWFPLAAAACVAAYATNAVLTATVVALHNHLDIRVVLRELGRSGLSTDGMLLALSPVFVVVAEESLLLLIPLLGTVMMVYRSAKLAQRREHDATHDHLTQLPNRRLFNERLADAVASAGRSGTRVGLVMLDLDEFKHINDGLGHQVGDHVLGLVAERLTSAYRSQDLVARLGGDEFAVLLTDLTDVDEAKQAAGALVPLFETPLQTDGFPVLVSASAGVAVYPDHAASGDALLRRADEAMYAAKSEQGGTRLYCPDQPEVSIGRLGLLADLQRAQGADELFLVYQPQLALASGDVVGVEALLRWRHPTVGIVQPDAFMPLAEQTELMGPLTEWVLRRALAQQAQWQLDGLALRMAVNVADALRDSRVDASALLLEITENTVALDRSTVRTVLQELRDLGVAVSIDDFGTGYSSIIQPRDLPVDQVKLDRQFVARMAQDPRDALIVRTIIQLGSALGLETVAEGVEDPLVATLLRDLGCDQAQGYLFAPPMPAEQLVSWLDSLDPWKWARVSEAPPPLQR